MLVFCDSFDHYTTLSQKQWEHAGGTGGTNVISSTYGRFDNGLFLRGGSGNPQALIRHPLATPGDVFIVGMALMPTNANSGANNAAGHVMSLQEGTTDHFRLQVDASRHLVATRAGTVLGTGTTVLALNVWNYVEVKVTIHDSAGTVEVRLNGAVEIGPLTSQDTRNGGTGIADWLGLYAHDSTAWQFDDLVVMDDAGSSMNDFIGDVRVQCLFPNGDGATSNLVGSDGNSTNNSLLVDEVTPNDDTDYVESSTVGDKDTYAYGNLTATAGTVYAVVPQPYAKKTDAGARTIASIARLSSTEEDSANKTLLATYQYLMDVRTTKPGGGAWTISDVNSAEFGVKVTA